MTADSETVVNNSPGKFDPLSFPLSGKRLIEASAGTGKTYNIANLFLRLILGHGSEESFSVDQILVVTFTRAATSELNGRIRARLEEALSVFRGAESTDVFLNQLVAELAGDTAVSVKRLNDAILSMDEASISTIHSFAVQAAKTFLFETGALADIQISESGYDARTQIVSDLYRKLSIQFSGSGYDFFDLVPGKDFKEFQTYYGNELSPDCLIRPDFSENRGFLGLYEQYNNQQKPLLLAHKAFSLEWRRLFPKSHKADYKAYINGITDIFNDQLFDEFKKPYKWTRGVSSLSAYLDGQLTGDSTKYLDKTGTKYFKSWMQMHDNAGEGDCFDLVLRLQKHFKACASSNHQTELQGKNLILQTLMEKQGEFALDQMSLDDIIRLINRKLEDEASAPVLRQIITQTYPVCLVDEFQDTDPEQFVMFNEIYSKAGDNTGFFMIGDPKQSIYAFRGADIFSYLNVRKKVQINAKENDPTIFSLDTNWRSKAALVEATNRLFSEPTSVVPPENGDSSSTVGERVFIFEGIEYQHVNSCEQLEGFNGGDIVDKGQLTLGSDSDLSDKPLVFIGNPATDKKELSKKALLKTYAADTAARISALLDGENGGSITSANGNKEPLSPGQLAVLVRDKWEAKAIRDALAKPEIGIRCVYLSQKESVFSDAEISEDIYHVLVAINENNVTRSLKTALATPLLRGFRFDFSNLEKIETHESELELLIEEFGEYKRLWAEHGVLTALSKLMDNRELYSEIAKRQDSDRLITDFRHLGDILQQRDMDTGTAEQLIDWYATQLNDDSALEDDSKRIRLESDENLVKIVTIHVSKGLEYPIVFLPFFYLPREIKFDKQLPLYHDEQADFRSVVDFESESANTLKIMEKESLAEDVRMLYVAITRAIYQCNIGISASAYGSKETVWKHLLGIDAKTADWSELKAALFRRIEKDKLVGFPLAGDVMTVKFQAPEDTRMSIEAPETVKVRPMTWQITSYSALAHGQKVRLGDKADDEAVGIDDADSVPEEPVLLEDDKKWQRNARYTLKGSAITGNCLHDIYETYALAPAEDFKAVVEKTLGIYALDKPRRDRNISNEDYQRKSELHLGGVKTWLDQALQQPLKHQGLDSFPSLLDLFESRQISPELEFDFAIGSDLEVPQVKTLNTALAKAGLDGLGGSLETIHGMMTGAIDLVFIHDRKVYVLDYKSNTLGKSPRFYDQEVMAKCMKDSRYDLQYMIYSTAVHRFFSRYFMDRYAFDPAPEKELSFGGVFYLFLRGMGLKGDEYSQHGIWFKRPVFEHIDDLDKAFIGDQIGVTK